MATRAELDLQLANARVAVKDLENEAASLSTALAEARKLSDQRRTNLLASGLDPATDAEYQGLAQQAYNLSQQSQQVSAQLYQARNQLAILQNSSNDVTASEQVNTGPGQTNSAGATAREDGAASGAPQQNEVLKPDGRITPVANINGESNATQPELSTAQNTSPDLPTRTLSQTQSTSGASNQGTPRVVDDNNYTATTQPGVGSSPEDTPTQNLTRQAVEARFTETVKAQPNILDKYYSYTYVAELRMIKPEDYLRLTRSRRFNFDNSGILIRSGGAKLGSVDNYEQKRNQYFDLDFYLDNIVIENKILGAATGSSHNYTDISFTVTETNGISFLDRLYAAVKQYIGIENYSSVVYIMLIKFYGYNEKGELQVVNNAGANFGDSAAVVTKIIPFTMKEIGFTISSGLVTYSCTGAAIMHNVAASSDRGTAPRNFEITGGTVAEVLGGTTPTTTSVATTGTTTSATAIPGIVTNVNQFGTGGPVVAQPSSSAPPAASTAASATANLTNSLINSLNEEQNKRVKSGEFTYADRYSIEFAEQAIASAKVNNKGVPSLDKTPMGNNANTRSNLPETQATDRNRKVLGVAAGTQIVQAIDMIIRNSTFILDQSYIVYDPTTDQPIPDPNSSKIFSWYKINMQAVPREYDTKRNDYAYDIKYVISLYEIKGMDSPYFPQGRFSGVHKSYPYWFTGQNTAVLDYKQTYNYAYSVTISGAAAQAAQTSTSSLQKIRKYTFAPRSGQSAQGADGRTYEPSANAAEYLYDQTALGETTLRIIGDPAWMQQGEVFPGPSATQFDYAPFSPDGTINFDAGEILFEIKWAKSTDYDINTGLMNIDPNRLGPNNPNLQSLVYSASGVKNEFKGGKFEQEIHGQLYIFEIPATTKVNPTTSDLQTPTVAESLLRAPSPYTNSPLATPPFVPNNSGTGINFNALQGSVDSISAAPLIPQAVPLPVTSGSGVPLGLTNIIPASLITAVNNSSPQLIKKEF